MTDASVTAYAGKETNGALSVHASQSAKTQTAHAVQSTQAPPYNIAMGQGPVTSVIQSGLTAPGGRPVGTSFNMSNMTAGQTRSILPHDPRQPLPVKPTAHDRPNQVSPTHQNPLSTDLQQIMQKLPSMTQPPPLIRNPRPQQPLSQYIGTTHSGGHEVQSSSNTQLGAPFQIGQSLLDYRKSPVQQTSHSKQSQLQFSQQSQPPQVQHQSASPHFPSQIPNLSLFHQHKQAVGQPFNPAPASPPMRPILTSSRSAGNIPTVAETLFGEQGLAGTRGVNPLASIFSQQQDDSGKWKGNVSVYLS